MRLSDYAALHGWLYADELTLSGHDTDMNEINKVNLIRIY